MSEDPFSVPSGSDFTNMLSTDFIGHLVLISPTEFIEKMPTTASKDGSDAVRCDFVDLNDPAKPVEFEDTLVFGKNVVPKLKRSIGGMVLGVVGQGDKKPGKNAPWILEQPTEEDKVDARKYLAAKAAATPDPFATAQ